MLCRNLRRILAATVVVPLWLSPASADTLTEADVIRLVRTLDPEAAAARESVSVAQAQELEVGLYPNPVLAWDREHYPGSGALAESEDAISLSVPVDLSGRRTARRELARSDVAAARSLAARTQSQATERALSSFYEALAAERRVDIARHSLTRLEEAARVLGRRHDEGTVSGYESNRLELEVEVARSLLREAEGRATLRLSVLARLLGVDDKDLSVRGALEVGRSTVAPPSTPPSVELARAAVGEANAARDSARLAWVPSLSVSGGLRMRQSGDTEYGYVAGLALALPIFSRGQDLTAEAGAKHRVALARARTAERSAQLVAARADAELRLAKGELVRFEEATSDRVERLLRSAESGYREGQRSVLELVDAQRARAEVESRRLDLTLVAKLAEIELRAARGEFE